MADEALAILRELYEEWLSPDDCPGGDAYMPQWAQLLDRMGTVIRAADDSDDGL